MSHIHWVAQQNKLEIPKDKDDVNKQDIHEYSSALSRHDGSDTAEFFFSVSISFFFVRGSLFRSSRSRSSHSGLALDLR